MRFFFSCIWVDIPVDWVILHWCACGADRRSADRAVYGHVITKFSRIDLLSYGAPLLPQSTLSLSVSLLSSLSSSLASSILVIPSAILQWNLFLWDTSIQETSPFRGHKMWSRKNLHIIFLFLLPLLKRHLYSEERDTFSGTWNPGLTSILEGALVLKKWLTKKALISFSVH